MDPVYAFGASGILIERLQRKLSEIDVTWPDGHEGSALDQKNINGRFGAATRTAVRLVQKKRGQPETGTVDATLWQVITGDPWPSEYARSLNLIAAFEGHGYAKAAGNWDNAGVTWGVVGFTLVTARKRRKSTGVDYQPNSLVKLLSQIIAAHPDFVTDAFGAAHANELKAVLGKTGADLVAFAERISDTSKKKYVLLPDWQRGFDALGQHAEVQDLQDQLARSLYYDPALKDAADFGAEFSMDCEQTRQLFFDIHVNNGAPGPALRKKMKTALHALDPKASITEKLLTITGVLASSRKKYETDIRERKGTISRGFGTVHKRTYRLEGWGIRVVNPSLSHGLGLGVLSFEPLQVGEQFCLAKAAGVLVNPEMAAQMGAGWPAGNGTELLTRTENGVTVSTLSLRPLLAPATANALGADSEALDQAVAQTFSRPVGILAVFGQGALTGLVTPRLLLSRGSQGYAGLDLDADDALQLFRQRLFSEDAQAAITDIGDIRAGLATCQLILLFGAHGIENATGTSSTGRRWRDVLAPYGAAPIVLGWFGGVRVTRDADREFVSETFINAIRQIDTAASLEDLCAKHGDDIVQAWGQACHATFASGRQRFLWRHGPFSDVLAGTPALASIGLSGAAAIGRDGNLWRASPTYPGAGKAMEKLS